MQKKKLGKQGPEVSVVGFGAWEAGGESYGPNTSEGEVIEAIHTGLDAGIDWIDTAEVYGNGISEQIVGKALQGRRDDVSIQDLLVAIVAAGVRRERALRSHRPHLGRQAPVRVRHRLCRASRADSRAPRFGDCSRNC